MYSKEPDIASLISSRICHDLVSPLGAISNGLELLELSGLPDGPEYCLLNESVTSATARINFFRYAFGARGDGTAVPENTLRTTLNGIYAGTRIHADWSVQGAVPRAEAKLALLLVQCLETFLPVGGRIAVAREEGVWRLSATGDRLRVPDENLAHLLGRTLRSDLKPSEIQFELARRVLEEERLAPGHSASDTEFRFSYRFSAA